MHSPLPHPIPLLFTFLVEHLFVLKGDLPLTFFVQ